MARPSRPLLRSFLHPLKYSPVEHDLALAGPCVWSLGPGRKPTDFDLNRRASPRPYLGAPGGEIPPGDSTNAPVELSWHVGFTPDSGRALRGNEPALRANCRHATELQLTVRRGRYTRNRATLAGMEASAIALDALLPVGIRLDEAGINRKAFAAD